MGTNRESLLEGSALGALPHVESANDVRSRVSDPRAIRKAAGWTQLRAAAAAGVSLVTLGRYELDPSAVRPDKAAALNTVYRRLAEESSAI